MRKGDMPKQGRVHGASVRVFRFRLGPILQPCLQVNTLHFRKSIFAAQLLPKAVPDRRHVRLFGVGEKS
jgi:hypothetical protein